MTGPQSSAEDSGSAVQLSLLQGFGAPRRPPGTTAPAAELPIAQVLIESAVPHLDRLFDYLVPETMAAEARPGVRVKVRFGAQQLNGFLVARRPEPTTGARLVPLAKVVSAEPVLTPEVFALATAVAARYAGTVSDVLRVAIPPRVARVEKEFAAAASNAAPGPASPLPASAPGSAAAPLLTRYQNGGRFLQHLAAGQAPRAVLTSLAGYGAEDWAAELAEAITVTWQSGRGALAVVPDQRDLARLDAALARRLGAENFVRLHAEDGPTQRYRSFLSLVNGHVRVAIGTRSAAYAPVAGLGLVAIWDDGDELHAEMRAPYQHAREVLLLRAEQSRCAALLAGFSRSTEAQRLVSTGWAAAIAAGRAAVRSRAPRVISSVDSYQQERDPLAARARLPHLAWQVAKDGLERGPVLVQVARTGFSPSMVCQDCREPARCRNCQGPLAQQSRDGQLSCRWCGQLAGDWHCSNCGSPRLRASAVGAGRTAEELGRAFPSTTVISSAADHIKDSVADTPALVVATPGAEPVAYGGYAAALLLDGALMLGRESLRAGEETLRRWFNAAVLVRPTAQGGTVVVTAEDSGTVGSLVRWDPAGAAERELAQRRELLLPPAVRYAALTGGPEALAGFLAGLDLPAGTRTVGPMPMPMPMPTPGRGPGSAAAGSGAGEERILIFFPYLHAQAVTAALKARRAALSARKSGDPVNIRCDGLDAL